MRKYIIFLLLIVPLLINFGCHKPKAPTKDEFYFAAYLNGQKMGHVTHTRIEEESQVINSEHIIFTIKRADVAMTISVKESYIETPQGEPLAFESMQYLGALGMTVKGQKNEAEKYDVTITTGDNTQTKTIDWPQDALMAEGAELLAQEKGFQQGTKYTTKIFVPMMLQAIDVEIEIGEKKNIDLLDRVIPCTEIINTMKMPSGQIVSTNYIDEENQPQKMIIPMMGMKFEMVACSREFALSENDVPEFLDQMILRSPESLRNYKKAKHIKYHLKSKPGVKLTVVQDDNQKVQNDGNSGLYVTVKPIADPKDAKFPYTGTDKIAREALKPTRYLQSDSDQIIKLAKQAVGDTKDAAQAARKIEGFVREYVKEKSLSIGYSSAVEVAISREGDCTEHAVLTAALCQAVGIPARLALGYIYADEWAGEKHIFVGHAWSQAYVGDKWIALDGTRGPNGYNAGHVTLAVGNGNPEDFFSLAMIQGQFTIAEIEIKQ
jgi:transglutaminase superfamily protein